MLIHHLNVIEDRNPSATKVELDNLIRMKDERKLVFGRILGIVTPSIDDPEVMDICREVKKARDTIAAHFFFVAPLDKNNRTKRAFYDVNNYRKIVRRLYALVREHQRLPQVEYFLNLDSPLTKISTIEGEEIAIERELLKVLCDQTRQNVKGAVSLLRRKPPGALTRYMNNTTYTIGFIIYVPITSTGERSGTTSYSTNRTAMPGSLSILGFLPSIR